MNEGSLKHSVHGAGVSLRSQHFSAFLKAKQPLDWLEIVADQFLGTRGALLDKLIHITTDYPINLHCVSMSIAGTDPININYLSQIRNLKNLIKPNYISDHLCWSSHTNLYAHDLLPFPYQKKTLNYIADRVSRIQDYLQSPLLLENLSHYMRIPGHELTEAEFLNELCSKTGCGILLDVNNVYVSSQNLQYDPEQWIKTIKTDHVKQCHLAGHDNVGHRLIDTHGTIIAKEVWALYQFTLQHIGAVPTCLEWDADIPDWSVMLHQCEAIKHALLSKKAQAWPKLTPITFRTTIEPPPVLATFQKDLWERLHNHKDIPTDNPQSVYQNSIRMQRLAAIASVYPCVKQCLGTARFQAIALGYLLTTPSQSPDISEHMDTFCNYLQQALEDDEHYLFDLSQYEWHWHQVFHGKNHEAVAMQALESAIRKHHHAITLQRCFDAVMIHTKTPVEQLWQACQPEYQGASVKVLLDNCQQIDYYYHIHQRNGFVITEQLSKTAYDCLQLLQTPTTLQAWCDKAAYLDHFDPNSIAYFYKQGFIHLV